MGEADKTEALAKRQRLQKVQEEGSYTAALRGSHSALWKQQQQQLKHLLKKPSNPTAGSAVSAIATSAPAAGACFKCGMTGHWSRDCSAGDGPARWGAVEVVDKPCPCGSGLCLVLVSNTVKNPGRRFYRCPVREDNGGCKFFEWCDNSSPRIPASKDVSSYQSWLLVPELPCPCGAGLCLVQVTKSGNNVGQQYYSCPANKGGRSCGFFRWCNEQTSGTSHSLSSTQFHGVNDNVSSRFSGSERTGSSCFKCGQEGHWARDCPKALSDSIADTKASHAASSGSGTCFKCGKAGHWARDCSIQDDSACKGTKRASNTFHSPYSY